MILACTLCAVTVRAATNPVDAYQLVYFVRGVQLYEYYHVVQDSGYDVQNDGWCAENHMIGGWPYNHIHFTAQGDDGFSFYFPPGGFNVTVAMADAGWDLVMEANYAWYQRLNHATFAGNCHNYAMDLDWPCISSGAFGIGIYRGEAGFEWTTPPVKDSVLSTFDHSLKIEDDPYEMTPPQTPPIWISYFRKEKNSSSGVYKVPHYRAYYINPPGYWYFFPAQLLGSYQK